MKQIINTKETSKILKRGSLTLTEKFKEYVIKIICLNVMSIYKFYKTSDTKKCFNNAFNVLIEKEPIVTSEDISHVKEMIKIWKSLVEGEEKEIKLTRKRVIFLRRAFINKFDSCLEKWKKYCECISSSKFLMKHATLDGFLKFEVIQKILDAPVRPI